MTTSRVKMDDNLEFTDDEIREELAKLGYQNVPDKRLAEFKKGRSNFLTLILQFKKTNFSESWVKKDNFENQTLVQGQDACWLKKKTGLHFFSCGTPKRTSNFQLKYTLFPKK